MTIRIHIDQVTEYEPHSFATEASTLSLAPGQWPEMIETDMGNGRSFVRTNQLPCGGYRYKQANGCLTLDVLND